MTGAVTIRPALLSDGPAIVDITKHVWGGTDYLPQVWHRWLRRSDGKLLTALVDNKVAGCQHVRFMPDGSSWLEGIRVAEEARNHGVAGALLKSGLELSRKAGCTIARLTTSSENEASNRLAVRRGFQPIESYSFLESCPHRDVLMQGARLGRPDDYDAVRRFLQDNIGYGSRTVFYTEGWTAYAWTAERIRLLLARSAIGVVENVDITGILVATCMYPYTTLRVGALEGNADNAAALCSWVRSEGVDTGVSRIRLALSTRHPHPQSAQAQGFAPMGEFTMLLYELQM